MADPLLRKPRPVILDREINSEDADAFGHRHYARALGDLIRDHDPSYSIGLIGPWAVGKSSIAQMCHRLLVDARGATKVVKFNAWRCGGQDIKRTLFRDVFLALGGDEQQLNERMWSTFSRTLSEAWPAPAAKSRPPSSCNSSPSTPTKHDNVWTIPKAASHPANAANSPRHPERSEGSSREERTCVIHRSRRLRSTSEYVRYPHKHRAAAEARKF